MEGAASAGEILVSPATYEHIRDRFPSTPHEPGFLLRSRTPRDDVTGEAAPARLGPVADGVPARVARTPARPVSASPSIARRQSGSCTTTATDELVVERGAASVADAVDELVRAAQSAADAEGVTFLGTDIDHDGGKIILVAGVPVSRGDDEGRMLRAVRRIVDDDR